MVSKSSTVMKTTRALEICPKRFLLFSLGSHATRAERLDESESALLLFGLATGLMWLRTLSFVLVQKDLGQVLLLQGAILQKNIALLVSRY